MRENKTTRPARIHRRKLLARAFALIVALTTTALCAFAQATNATMQVNDISKKDDGAVEKSATKAATKATPRKTATSTLKQSKIGDVNFSGSLRLRAENYGWFETPGFDDDYTFGAAVLRLAVGQQREKFDWQVEGESIRTRKPPTGYGEGSRNQRDHLRRADGADRRIRILPNVSRH
jgi:hypothetical protein